MSDSVRPHRRQPARFPRPWDSPGKNTGVGCPFLLQHFIYIYTQIHACIHFQICFLCRLFCNTGQSSPCFTAAPCCSSILNIAECTCPNSLTRRDLYSQRGLPQPLQWTPCCQLKLKPTGKLTSFPEFKVDQPMLCQNRVSTKYNASCASVPRTQALRSHKS